MTNGARRKTEYRDERQGLEPLMYIGGSSAPAVRRMPRRVPDDPWAPKKLEDKKRRDFRRLKSAVIKHILFMTAAIGVLAFVCTFYLSLQSQMLQKQREITKLESQLNELTISNDEEYTRIMGAVDLEEIKRVAMEDLGMTYPAESQMVAFTDDDSDYVRQYNDFPKQ